MKAWLLARPCLRNLLTGIVLGLGLLLLAGQQLQDQSGQGTASYYSQF
ncbi:MAG: hypothetical protein HQL43_04705 [Alphaproteobacteria bacterium]|nr:hypothetical protein [Alphaproteobacteria bacterium]